MSASATASASSSSHSDSGTFSRRELKRWLRERDAARKYEPVVRRNTFTRLILDRVKKQIQYDMTHPKTRRHGAFRIYLYVREHDENRMKVDYVATTKRDKYEKRLTFERLEGGKVESAARDALKRLNATETIGATANTLKGYVSIQRGLREQLDDTSE
jgi:hypothetical protein